MASPISPIYLYLIMLGMLISGSLNIILLKLQGLTYSVTREDERVKFDHPFFQTFLVFFSEFLCLGAYGILYWRNVRKYGSFGKIPEVEEARKRGLKTDINVCLLAIPACLDVTGTSLNFLALTMIAASIFQMMGGFVVFVAAIFSIILLKRRYHRHHWAALIFVVGGVAIVGASPILYPNEEEQGGSISSTILGIVLIIIAQLFAGAFMTCEEKLLSSYHLHPLKIVGWEGFWATSLYLILLTVFQFIICENPEICPNGVLEDSPGAIYSILHSPSLFSMSIIFILTGSLFNAFGVSVTKYASAAQRSTIDTSRTLVIWVVFLLKRGEGGEEFIWLELVGFGLLVLGTLVFNEILVVRVCGFGRGSGKVEGGEEGEEEDEGESGYAFGGDFKVSEDKERLIVNQQTDM